MNVLCVYFPRLQVQAAVRNRPHLAGRKLVLVTAAGDDALVAATTNGPSLDGVVPGMRAAEARRMSPRAAFAPGGIALSLDILEPTADLLRGRVTPLIEIGGIDHLFLGMPALDGEPRANATRIGALVRSWSGLEVRVGVGPSRASAFDAARCARSGVGVEDLAAVVSDTPIRPWRRDTIEAAFTLATPADATRAAKKLAAVLTARGEGWRTFRVTGAAGAVLNSRTTEPVYESEALEARLRAALADLGDDRMVRVTLGDLAPDLRVKPYLGGARRDRVVAAHATRPALPSRWLRAAG